MNTFLLSGLFKFRRTNPSRQMRREGRAPLSLCKTMSLTERILWGTQSLRPIQKEISFSPTGSMNSAENDSQGPVLSKQKRHGSSLVSVLFLALFLSQGLFAADAIEPAKVFYPAASPAAAAVATPPGVQAPITTSVIYLIFLGAMGYVAYVLWRRKVAPQRTSPEKGATLDIATTRALGNRQFLVVVKYKEQELLLGVGQGFITRLDGDSAHVPTSVSKNLSSKKSSSCKK